MSICLLLTQNSHVRVKERAARILESELYKKSYRLSDQQKAQLSTPILTVTFITLVSYAKSREAELRWVIVKLTLQNMVHLPICLDTALKETLRGFASGRKQTSKLQGF
jgi:hypothetical protein